MIIFLQHVFNPEDNTKPKATKEMILQFLDAEPIAVPDDDDNNDDALED